MVMDQIDIITSEIMAKEPHEEETDGCDHCCLAIAVKGNDRYKVLHKSIMANLLDENPFAGLVIEPVSQAVFNSFLMGIIVSKAATIAAIEKGELEVWRSVGKAAGQTGK